MSEKRRVGDRGMHFSGFRDVTKVTITILLAIIAYFLKGIDTDFHQMKTDITKIKITVAENSIKADNTATEVKILRSMK